MIVLNAMDGNHVDAFQKVLTVLQDGSSMLILSGVAKPNLFIDDDDDIQVDEMVVKLGITSTELRQYTSQLGVASFKNDESSFLFAADSSEVYVNRHTNELELKARLAVSGDNTILHRVSFQITAVVRTFLSSAKGKIIWKKDALNPSSPYNAFEIFAGKPVRIQSGTISYDGVEPAIYGKILPGTHKTGADEESVEYIIENIPVYQKFVIHPSILNTANPLGSVIWENQGTSNIINLDTQTRTLENINFLISRRKVK